MDSSPPVSCRLECHCMQTEVKNPEFITSHCKNRYRTLYHLWLDNIRGQLKLRGLKNPVILFKTLRACRNMERSRSAHLCSTSIPQATLPARLFVGTMARGPYGKRCKPAAGEEMLRTHLSRCCHPPPRPLHEHLQRKGDRSPSYTWRRRLLSGLVHFATPGISPPGRAGVRSGGSGEMRGRAGRGRSRDDAGSCRC